MVTELASQSHVWRLVSMCIRNTRGTGRRTGIRKPVNILLLWILFQAMPVKNVWPLRSQSAGLRSSLMLGLRSLCGQKSVGSPVREIKETVPLKLFKVQSSSSNFKSLRCEEWGWWSWWRESCWCTSFIPGISAPWHQLRLDVQHFLWPAYY